MSLDIPVRRLPVRPNANLLQQEAEALWRVLQVSDTSAQLADAQLVLARSYEAASWRRLMQAVQLANAIWSDDVETLRDLITANPALVHEPVLVRESNWGPPMSYAANLGRDRMIRLLHERGATDLEHAAGRAALQGQVGTARLLHELAGSPPMTAEALGGPAYTLNTAGTALMLSLGAPVVSEAGACLAPVAVVLETDGRHPPAKHEILALYEQHGLVYPDTPTMALHRGRLDLLEVHLSRDPLLFTRTFTHREIYPAEMGCREPIDATTGTPPGGSTLLHLCVEYDEYEIAEWCLARGADVNARSVVGRSGFGGHTPLFNTVVSQPNFWMNYGQRGPFTARFTELLLAHGADPNVRTSLWKQLHPGHGDSTRHDYRDVTPLSWGRRFHAPIFVSEPALHMIEEAGGQF